MAGAAQQPQVCRAIIAPVRHRHNVVDLPRASMAPVERWRFLATTLADRVTAAHFPAEARPPATVESRDARLRTP
jgi:hypothetical protein